MILRRYMISQVLTTTALVLGFLVVMLLGGRLIRYFGMAAEGGLDVGVLFYLIGYNLPFFLELILPLSFFIGLMLVFGRMYVDNEMAVLSGCGISRSKLAWFLLPLVAVLFFLEAWLSLVAKPWGIARANNIWQEQSVVKIFDLIRPKRFISSGDYHLYVGEVGENGEYLKDVMVILMNGKGKPTQTPNQTNEEIGVIEGELPKALISQNDSIIFAKSATQIQSSDGSILLDLHQGRRYEVNTQSQQYSQVGFGRYRLTLAGKSDGEHTPAKIESVPTHQLIAWLSVPTSTYHLPQITAELGYRASLPWLMVIALLLAVPLSTVQPRKGRWLRLIPAIFIFVANVLIVISLKETIAKGKIALWAYPVVMLVLFAFAVYLNYHGQLLARWRLNGKLASREA